MLTTLSRFRRAAVIQIKARVDPALDARRFLLSVIGWKRLCNRSAELDQGVIVASLGCFGYALKRRMR
jgi:hypothetical protein